MQLEPTHNSNFGDALHAHRALHNQTQPDSPNLAEWLKYWNDDESFAVNMRNLEHWISCARTRVS
jgi:hypothetical protein